MTHSKSAPVVVTFRGYRTDFTCVPVRGGWLACYKGEPLYPEKFGTLMAAMEAARRHSAFDIILSAF